MMRRSCLLTLGFGLTLAAVTWIIPQTWPLRRMANENRGLQ